MPRMTTNMAERRTISGCLCCLVLVLALIDATPSSNQECAAWASLAKTLTGNGHTQTCDNTHTSKCTRLDCEGIFRAEFDPIVLDYCFGSQINPCSQPLSMNFYISLPEKNFSQQILVEHNEKVSLNNLKIPLGSLGKVSPVFLFELEKMPNGFILFTVTMKIQLKLTAFNTEVYLPRLEQTIINTTQIPAENCSKSHNATGPFEIGSCHGQATPGPATPGPTKRPTVIPSIKPSATLNKACHFVRRRCSRGEICDQRISRCKCDPDFHLSPKKDACISYSNIAGPCQTKDDCGFNEICDNAVCQCLSGYQYDPQRALCNIPNHEVVPTHSPDGGDKTTAKPVHASKKGINKYIIIFASVGAVVLIVLVVMGFLCYRRRRNVIHIDFNESDQPLLNSLGDENDMNIIM